MTVEAQTGPQLEIDGLAASGPEPLPFGGGALSIRAFRLERPAGDLLIYATPGMTRGSDDGGLLGSPVTRHYLNHWHEAMFLPERLGAFGARLVVHEADRAEAAERSPLAVHGFDRRHHPDPDFEVIPTPGHTPGATAYLWDTGEHRLLFTGDSLYLRDGKWMTAVLDSSDPVAYAESLELIAGLDFDVLVPWAAIAGQAAIASVEPGEAENRIERLIAEIDR